MVRLLLSAILIPLVSGCSLITEPPSEIHKVCTKVGFTSQLTISIQSQSVLPEYFSAMINENIVVDECTTGSPNRYVFKRHNDYNATLTLYDWPESPFSQEFFNPQGVPYDRVDIDAVISGRVACDADPINIGRVQKPVTWTEIYQSSSACGLDGYLGN